MNYMDTAVVIPAYCPAAALVPITETLADAGCHVIGVSVLNNNITTAAMDLSHFAPMTAIRLFFIGMMAASLYAIVLGPTTLEVPQEPLGIMNFNVYACAIGIALVVGMQVYRNHMERA